MGGHGHGKGQGRGPPRSEEERRHARQVNAARAAEGLATKFTGSVSRSKARALAHRAAIDSKVIPGEAIGAPAILPPPPPKAPTREPVVLREAQPMSGGKSAQYSGPSTGSLTKAPQAKGETPPQDRGKHGPQYTEEIPTTSGETSSQDMGKKRPKAPDSEGKGTKKTRTKQGEVLPKDKRALEATSSDYSTESDEGGEVLASSSTTHGSAGSDFAPLQRQRTRLWTLLLLSVLVKRVWQRQVNTPPGPVARRVEARQRYMVGSSNLVFPSPCCRLCRRHLDSNGVPAVLVELYFNG